MITNNKVFIEVYKNTDYLHKILINTNHIVAIEEKYVQRKDIEGNEISFCLLWLTNGKYAYANEETLKQLKGIENEK